MSEGEGLSTRPQKYPIARQRVADAIYRANRTSIPSTVQSAGPTVGEPILVVEPIARIPLRLAAFTVVAQFARDPPSQFLPILESLRIIRVCQGSAVSTSIEEHIPEYPTLGIDILVCCAVLRRQFVQNASHIRQNTIGPVYHVNDEVVVSSSNVPRWVVRVFHISFPDTPEVVVSNFTWRGVTGEGFLLELIPRTETSPVLVFAIYKVKECVLHRTAEGIVRPLRPLWQLGPVVVIQQTEKQSKSLAI